MKFTETLALTRDAFRWYATPDRAQYDDGPLELYDEAARLLTSREELAQQLVDFIGEAEGDVLEVAAGSGLVSSVMAEVFPGMQCIDLSHEALYKLQARTKNAFVSVADFTHLPFDSGRFALVVDVGGYRYVNDPDAHWQEVARIVQPGGRYVVAQFHPRVYAMKGRDVEYDLLDPSVQSTFTVARRSVFLSSASVGGLVVRTGQYHIFECLRVVQAG